MQEPGSEQENRASDSSGARLFSGQIVLTLDPLLTLSERHLSQVMKKYEWYFSRARPHQAMRQTTPSQREPGAEPHKGG